MIVVKLGGSLIHRARGLVREITEYSKASGKEILIVPGGSIFADMVRKANPSQEAAHWMAVLAMEQYAYYLRDGSEAKLTDNLEIKAKGTYILLPYALLKKKDELPHSWDVTSDTIAAWVAKQLGARFIKATDVDGIYLGGILKKEILAAELAGMETCVDAELPHFLMRNNMECEVINGDCPGRLIKALEGNPVGTLIKG
ncbi:5-(aminomethyl)-3-furanmethanol phosphate kinase [uncultured archaeon]|nr:5-(aminomethyl)-3-furanmethanol phosphate kinase [uncultured archaeon]